MQADGAAAAAADDAAPSEARMSALMSDALFAGFETHVERLKAARKRRQEVLAFKGALEMDASTAENEGGADRTQDELEGLGVRLPTDRWQGDVNMRTLEKLLARVDARGYERCVHANPLRFRHALRALHHRGPNQVRAAARVPHGLHEGRQPRHLPRRLGNGSANDYGEVWLGHVQVGGAHLNSTSFRKDVFVGVCASKEDAARLLLAPSSRPLTTSARVRARIAIFCACLALSFGLEIVVFSPARRASRKLLERIVEFVRLAGGESKIVEYNQEACRLHSFDGKKSLIRSFPSKVGVSKKIDANSNRD